MVAWYTSLVTFGRACKLMGVLIDYVDGFSLGGGLSLVGRALDCVAG